MSSNLNNLYAILAGIQPTDSVETGFNKLLTRIRTTPAESAAAASHRKSIESVLQRNFSMSGFFRTGSFGAGTNIAGCSDVDYFAVIPPVYLKPDSSASLEDVADVLRDRFPLSGVRVDAPGIRVPFGPDGAETTEIVPVYATGTTKLGFRQFDMPDRMGGWMFTAPESHNAYVDWIDKKHFGKVKPLIRFLKAWNFKKNVAIRSFYLEIWAARYADAEASIIYDIDISRLLDRLATGLLADLPDPRFPYDNLQIRACNTEAQKVEALKKLMIARDWAADAVAHRMSGGIQGAFERWSLVYNHDFPAYKSY